MKGKLTSVPYLISSNWDLPFHIYCDGSNFAVGSALCQPFGDGNNDRSIAFASMQLTGAKQNYTTTERGTLAMVFSVKKYRFYFLLSKVVFFVDRMVFRYLVNKPDLSMQIARWISLFQEFDYEVVYKPGGCISKQIICRGSPKRKIRVEESMINFQMRHDLRYQRC